MLRLSDKITHRDGLYWFKRDPRARSIRLGYTARDAEEKLGRVCPDTFSYLLKTANGMKRCKAQLYSSMLARSKRNGLACMSKAEFQTLWSRANGKCELTAIEFTVDKHEQCVKRPWSPSVDRKNNSKGYEFANCRLVCTAVNLALNEFGDAVLRRIANGLR